MSSAVCAAVVHPIGPLRQRRPMLEMFAGLAAPAAI